MVGVAVASAVVVGTAVVVIVVLTSGVALGTTVAVATTVAVGLTVGVEVAVGVGLATAPNWTARLAVTWPLAARTVADASSGSTRVTWTVSVPSAAVEPLESTVAPVCVEKVTCVPGRGWPYWSSTVAVSAIAWLSAVGLAAANVKLVGASPGIVRLTSALGSLSAPWASYARTTTKYVWPGWTAVTV